MREKNKSPRSFSPLWRTKPLTPPDKHSERHQNLNTNDLFVCLLVGSIAALRSFPVTFEGVDEELPLMAEEGRPVIAVVFGVVVDGGVAA